VHTPQARADQSRTYVVQANDTLSAIASRLHSSQSALMRFNRIADANRLRVGQVLAVPEGTGAWIDGGTDHRGASYDRAQVPANGDRYGASERGAGVYPTTTTVYTRRISGAEYVVQPGDTLGTLSGRFGVSVAALAAANGIARPELLRIGQRLLVPGRTASAVSTGTPAAVTPAVPAASAPTPTVTPTPAAQPTAITGGAIAPAGSAAIGVLLAGAAATYGVDPALVKAVAWQESGWRMVVARDGGIGVMQLMPATAAWVGPALLGRTIDPYNLQDNIQAGVALLASYLRDYGGNLQQALAAYNEGPKKLASGIFPSTLQYINAVLALRSRYTP
jgi:LysM repeat protein